MTDINFEAPASRTKATPPRREFMAYFTVIFLAALPLATLMWVLKSARTFSLPERGPIASAWSQARIITPHIFQGG